MPSVPKLAWKGNEAEALRASREILLGYLEQGKWDEHAQKLKAHWRPDVGLNERLFGIVMFHANKRRALPFRVMEAVAAALNMTHLARDLEEFIRAAHFDAVTEVQKLTRTDAQKQCARGLFHSTVPRLARLFKESERSMQERRAMPEYQNIKQALVEHWLNRCSSTQTARAAFPFSPDQIEVKECCRGAVAATRGKPFQVAPIEARRAIYLIVASHNRKRQALPEIVLIALAAALQLV